MIKIPGTSGLTLTPTSENARLLDHIDMRTLTRNQKNTHIIYKFFPDINGITDRVYWGVFSWTIPSIKHRLILRNSSMITGGGYATKGDIVRDYLNYYHPKKLRAIGAEARQYWRHFSAPLYVNPHIGADYTYVDITATYWNIMKLIGWNVKYMRNEWYIPGRPPLDFPLKDDKTARNYLLSCSLPTPMTIWTGSEFMYKSVRNEHTNLSLWTAAQDILHSLALIAVRLGAIYVHTDGYILPSQNAELMADAISSFHLSSSIRASGETAVFGFGNYICGDKRTKVVRPDLKSQPHVHIRETPIKWIKKNLDIIQKSGALQYLYEQSLDAV